MIGLLRKRRLLAPVLFGSLLTGGCQLFGTNTEPLRPPSHSKDQPLTPKTAPSATGTSAVRKLDEGPELSPAKEASRTGPAADNRETAEPMGKEATSTVVYVPHSASGSSDMPKPGLSVLASSDPDEVGPHKPTTTATHSAKPPQVDGSFAREGEMSLHYEAGGTDLKALETRMQQLEHRLEQRDKVVHQSGEEMQAATAELHRTLAHVETLRKEVEESRSKVRERDQEEIESLLKTIKTVEQMLGE